VVTKLDRLARSLPDARAIADELTAGQVKLNLGGSVHDPTDPVGRLLFNVLAMVAEFEADLARMRPREGMKVARAKGRLRGEQPELSPKQEAHLVGLYRAGGHTIGELEELFSVTRSTVYRAVARAGARAAPAGGASGVRPGRADHARRLPRPDDRQHGQRDRWRLPGRGVRAQPRLHLPGQLGSGGVND
jgi:DNA invertase Pin-like site-specific DNA recombinase